MLRMPRTVRAAALAIVMSPAVIPIVLLASPAGAAQRTGPQSHVVVILLDRMAPDDLSSSSSIQGLAARGAAGLMTTATVPGDRGQSPFAPMVTLSAGRAAAGPPVCEFPSTVQPGPPDASTRLGPIADLYRRRIGEEPTGALVYPDEGLVARLNGGATIRATPGLLGQSIRDAGLATAVVGNSDLPGNPFRPGVILAMDERGQVQAGTLDTTKVQTGVLPVATDPGKIQKAVTDAYTNARFIVVDWGDTSRVARLAREQAGRLGTRDPFGRTLRDRLDAAREASLSRLDQFVAALLRQVNLQRDVVVIMSSSPPYGRERQGVELAPILVAGGPVRHGTLTSDTTGQPGLVSNVDLAPNVLAWLDVTVPRQMLGHRFEVDPNGFPVSVMREDEARLTREAHQRVPILAALLMLSLVAMAVAAFVLETRLRLMERVMAETGGGRRSSASVLPDTVPTPVRALLYGVAFVPLVLLLLPLAGGPWALLAVSLAVPVGACVGLGFLWAVIARRRFAAGLGTIGAFTAVALLANLLAGDRASNRSLAGPNVWDGGHLLGLGTLLAGAAVAGGIVGGMALARRFRRPAPARRALGLPVLVVVMLLGVPPLGGTAHVAIAGTVGVAVAWTLLEDRPAPRWVWLAGGAAVAAGLLVAAVVLVVHRATEPGPGPGTGAPGTSAPAVAAALILRWSSEAARLLLLSPWTVIILASGAVLAYVRIRVERGPWVDAPRGIRFRPLDRYVGATVTALTASAVVGLLSGVGGPAVAAVILLGAAVLSLGASLERARPDRSRL